MDGPYRHQNDDRVGGSSLNTGAFNDALPKLKTEL